MGIMDRVKWNWDKTAVVVGLLEKWRPRNCKTEKDYENSLYLFLHKELEDRQITKQPGQGRYHADIAIDDKILIEIKYDLNTTAKYTRLVGQVVEYKDWKGQVIILLTGETDPNFKKQLLARLEKEGLRGAFNPADPFGLTSGDKVIVVEKP